LNDLTRATATRRPDQAQLVERLKPLVGQKFQELNETIELRQSRGLAAALAIVETDRGKAIMDQIRAVCADSQSVAKRHLAGFLEDMRSEVNLLGLVSSLGSALLLALLFLSSFTIERGIQQRDHLIRSLDKSEARTKEANEWLRTTLFSIGDGVIAADAGGKVTLLNGIAQSVTGWSQDEAAGKPLDQVFVVRNADTNQELENPVRKVLREGGIVSLAEHMRLIARDGRQIPIDHTAAPILDANHIPVGVVLVFRDITDRQRAEATQQLLASVIEFSDDAIVTKDMNGIVTSWNRGAERIFGYSANEMIGQPISILAPPGRADEMARILDRIRRGERIDHFQTLRRTKGGKLIHISITVSPVRDASGRVTGASKIARNITAQIEAQEEITVERERLRVTLNSIGDAVISTGPTGCVSYVNPVAEQLTGWTCEAAAEKPLQEVFHILNEESRQTVENPVVKVLREGQIIGLANHTLLISRDGREIAIDDSAAPIKNVRNEIIGVVLVFRDVTARRAAERLAHEQAVELRLSNAALSRANEDLSQFAFAASHDLQEPLRMITVYSQLLFMRHRGQLNDEAEMCLEFITEGSKRMRELLSDLLSYTQLIGTGQETEPFASIDLNQVFAKTIENCKTAIQETSAVVTGDELPSIPGHEHHFIQLFQNLIANALKYRSDRSPRVHVSAERKNGLWLFSVADNGIGIAPEYHKQIFGVFKRLHGKSIAGTGIGLAICQRVVDRYGGRIWVESQIDSGATFYFTLPGT
jgi:PAS domain S-box-containing protein